MILTATPRTIEELSADSGLTPEAVQRELTRLFREGLCSTFLEPDGNKYFLRKEEPRHG